MEPSTPSRRGTFDLPKPETGLAEWTSRIKALQQQVDADEEAEQKRLEEEIVAARRARLRRSRGVGYGGDGVDLLVSSSGLGVPSSKLNKSPSSEVLKSSSDKRLDQEDALRRLTGSSSSTIDTSSITKNILPRPSQFPPIQPTQSKQTEPVSLASFIGGRATGPRLNRHAPQQDAHDPTQFEQRNTSAPHPIFGKGGVAMPGLVTKPGTAVRDAVKAADAIERYQPRQLAKRPSAPSLVNQAENPTRSISPQKSGSRDRTISNPSVTSRQHAEYVEHRPLSPQKSGNRERTLSTPGFSPSIARSTDNTSSRPVFARPGTEAKSPKFESRPKSAGKDRISTPSRSTTPPRGLTRGPTTPHQLPAAVPSSPGKSLVSTPSLARAIQPEPRSSSQSLVVSNTIPSPAFQKPLAQKDPTPSISRLQGRGFVQNMVRVSTQLESPAKSVSSSPTSRPSSGRKSSVLDRWQPNAQITSSPTLPPNSRQMSPVRKAISDVSLQSDPQPMKAPTSTPTPATPSPLPAKVVKAKTSYPRLHPDPLVPPEPLSPRRAKMAERMLPPEGSTGFGSATTMVVYKPKTPEPPSLVEQTSPSAVDELGVKHDSSSDEKDRQKVSVRLDTAGPSGKPLNHPTKDRARKPKKGSDVSLGQPPRVKSSPDPVKDSESLRKTTLSLPRAPPQTPRASSPGAAKESSSSSHSPAPPKGPGSWSKTEPFPELSQVAQITQKWDRGPIIGVKQVTSSSSYLPSSQILQHEIKTTKDSNLIRRALPGMSNFNSPPPPPIAKSPSPESTLQVLNGTIPGSNTTDSSPSSSSGYTGSPSGTEGHPKSSSPPKTSDRPPRSPSSPKHTRIPSTGNRALVMDVAQALNDFNAGLTSEGVVPHEETQSPVTETTPDITVRSRVAPSLERRRSSYDRFSAVSVMPPLKEEATPHGTPVGTLVRAVVAPPNEITLNKEQTPNIREEEQKNIVHFNVNDIPLPPVNIPELLRPRQVPPLSSPDAKTISVDILSINGNSSNAVSHDADIFYDSELLTIIHRYKSRSSGLVSTQLWVWYGKKNVAKEKEELKVQELAKRYNTSPIIVHQNSEPPSLVHILGGKLVIRQGNRFHWSADNTTMFSIRTLGGVTFIDEHDFSVKNLCSAFSYCFTILDNVYLWYGCGSTNTERQAAAEYASRISKGESKAIQLYEGENDQDELFWMALGDDEYAKADYWQWRRQALDVDPRIWRVDLTAKPPIVEIQSFKEESARSHSIYIIDCVWELFVKVGSEARGDRSSIKLALNVARRFAETAASSRPFTPTVHVLVLPSKLPLDLRLNLRELDDAELNNGDIPDHMNLLSSAQAQSHLHQHSWERPALQDQSMLPLGVSAPHGT